MVRRKNEIRSVFYKEEQIRKALYILSQAGRDETGQMKSRKRIKKA